MRQVVAVTVVTLTLGVTACSGDEVDVRALGERTCALVRSGVAAFNEQDYATTIAKFEAATEPARQYADAADTQRADDLLEAVEYYAALPADEYRGAFETSKEFAKHQATTLGQCGDAQPEDSPADESQT